MSISYRFPSQRFALSAEAATTNSHSRTVFVNNAAGIKALIMPTKLLQEIRLSLLMLNTCARKQRDAYNMELQTQFQLHR